MAPLRPLFFLCLLFFCLGTTSRTTPHSHVKFYKFDVTYADYTRLCHTKALIAVNGQFPGPTIYATEGDRLIVNVTNNVQDAPLTIHWHGVRQLLSAWADGPAYITQCPIQPGKSFLYDFKVIAHRGTLFWHAHVNWLRATVYGALVIKPAVTGRVDDSLYPFPNPDAEFVLLLGEWWNDDVLHLEVEMKESGGSPMLPDAYTINGLPGPFYEQDCLQKDEQFTMQVMSRKTYMLRLINAGLQGSFFFAIANHTLTVVEADAAYTKQFSTFTVLLSPGQTMNVLLTADQPPDVYYIVASPYDSFTGDSTQKFPTPAAGYLAYTGATVHDSTQLMPEMPASGSSSSLKAHLDFLLRSLNSTTWQVIQVPTKIDRYFFLAISLGLLVNSSCSPYPFCLGPSNLRFAASINNISFILPNVSLLETAYAGNPLPTDFPDFPAFRFNYTGPSPSLNSVLVQPKRATKISIIEANQNVELILQDTSFVGFAVHSFHLHGYSFYLVGSGLGNFDPITDPKSFNLDDPPLRNTVAIPAGGWAAIRFKADNPGIWFLHCHIESHNSWGMRMAFWVRNGGLQQTLPPPPSDLPRCQNKGA